MGFYAKEVVVRNYGKLWRNIYMPVVNGKVVVKNDNGQRAWAKVKDSEIVESKEFTNGKYTHWVKYGDFEKERKDGTTYKIMHYYKGSSRGLHGFQIRKDYKLEGYKGICYTFYSRGKFLWQKFVYLNGVVAYYMRWNDTTIKAVHPNKAPLFVINVNRLFIAQSSNYNREGDPFIYHKHYEAKGKFNLSIDGLYCDFVFYNHRGRIREQGKYERNQQVGEWIRKYHKYFFLSGLEVPKDLYEAKPEDIPAYKVLDLENAQVRAMFLKKVGYNRVVKECKGKIIDKDKNYELIDFPVRVPRNADENEDRILRLLKVVCPSTQGEFFLKIPSTDDFKTCAKARNGTFTKFEPKAKEVVFAEES